MDFRAAFKLQYTNLEDVFFNSELLESIIRRQQYKYTVKNVPKYNIATVTKRDVS